MLEPLYDKILIDPLLDEKIDIGGLEISSSADKSIPRFGKVLAVGHGLISNGCLIPLKCKVGDKIMYPNFGGTTVYDKGNKYLLIKETDILGIVKE